MRVFPWGSRPGLQAFALAWQVALSAAAGAARAEPSIRVDVPIAQVVLPDGTTRYSVPVTVGDGSPIEAALDTGSFGLRVLKRAPGLGRYEATTVERRYGYGSGARLNGVLARAEIAIGAAKTREPMLFQLVESVDCMPQKPKCPASRVEAKDYRIAGDGYPGAGFDAILGLSMRRAPALAGANNPIAAMGGGRWIILLPKPGDAAPGHLIINPDDEETTAFTSIHLPAQPPRGDEPPDPPGWKDTALPGCLTNEGSKERICGQTLFDSGAPGFTVNTSGASAPALWPRGASATLRVSAGDQSLDMPFTIGRDGSTRVRVAPGDQGEDRIIAGSLPFFFYAVLYDQAKGVIGLKPREDR